MKFQGELKNIFELDQLLHLYSSNIFTEFDFNFESIEVDLSNTTFISPLGAISILLLLDKLDQTYFVKVLPPPYNVMSYIERMNFLKHCTEEVFKCFEEDFDLEALGKRTRHNRKETLLEITQIENDEDIDTVYESVFDILTSHGMNSKDVVKVAWIASELCCNILDHSEGKGYAAIQYYPKQNRVQLAIGDNGVGIVNSLKPALVNQNIGNLLTNLEVMEYAFEKRISSVDEHRGMGLFDTRTKSFEHSSSTSFYIRTHEEIYEISSDRIEVIQESGYFPGTYISLEISFDS